MCLALRASGLWLRYAALQNLIPSFPWIAPPALHPGTIQGKEGIKFCHLATMHLIKLSSALVAISFVAVLYGQHVLRSGGEYSNAVEAERRVEIVLSQESGVASNAGK